MCKEDCSPFDIGPVYKDIARFSNAETFRFIQNVCKPDRLFNFPSSLESGDRHQTFKPDWLVRFPWLLYSKYLDGAFCLPCVCFGMESGKNGAKLNKLFRSPLTFWTACTKFQLHPSGKSDVHGSAVFAMQEFTKVMRNEVVPIDQQLNHRMQAQVRENREKMKFIVKTVIVLAKTTSPLEGRRDDCPDCHRLQGNFQALLAFRIDGGDEMLKEHLENAPIFLNVCDHG